jgi:hypothetical protein
MDEKVTAALIAASVSAVGSVLTLLGARWQVESKLRELEQTQLKDVLQAAIRCWWPRTEVELSTYLLFPPGIEVLWRCLNKPRGMAHTTWLRLRSSG